MKVEVDTKEQNEELKALADGVVAITIPGTPFQADIRVTCADGQVLVGERKTFADYLQTWMRGDLERQLSYVHFLVVETDPDVDVRYTHSLAENALTHLTTLTFALPVLRTTGPADTMRVMRDIARRGTVVRENRVKHKADTVLEAMIGCLPRINPKRALPNGRSLYQTIEPVIDRDALVAALNLDAWRMPGIGKGTLDKIRTSILTDKAEPDPFVCAKCVRGHETRPEDGVCSCGGVVVDREKQGRLS